MSILFSHMNKCFAYFLSSALFVASATTALGFGFSTIVKKEDTTLVYSKCHWESDPHINKVPLSGMPGKSDQVWIHTGGKPFVFDVAPVVGRISFMYNGNALIEGKKLSALKGGLHMEAAGSANGNNIFTMKKSLGDLRGSITFSVWEKVKAMGNCKIVLEDSKIEAKGDIVFKCPPAYLVPTKNRSGIDFELTGDSYIRCKGELILDTIINTSDVHFRFTLNEKDGKVPFVSFKAGNVSGVELRLNIKGKLKKGIYPLVEFSGMKGGEGRFKSISINGSAISVGSSTSINGSEVTIKMGSVDKKKENDYVLEVK